MKESMYNIVHEYGNTTLLYNSLYGSLVSFEKTDFNKHMDIIKNPSNDNNPELLQPLIAMGFIVDDDIDEYQYHRTQVLLNQYDSHNIGLTILPTQECNFSCFYCYENNDNTKTKMSNATIESIIGKTKDMFANFNPAGIDITWSGGEPLLSIETIRVLSKQFIKLCKRYKTNYSASIVTNGYLINKSIINLLKKTKIKSMQISLDGSKEIHDTRRNINNTPSFETIISNVKLCLKSNLRVNIRVNIDNSNKNSIPNLFSELEHRGIKNKLHIYLSRVESINNFDDSGICMNEYDFDNWYYQFIRDMKSIGWEFPNSTLLIPNLNSYCCADNYLSLVLDSDGNIYKCWNDTGFIKRSLGNINAKNDSFDLVNSKNKYSMHYPDGIEKCKTCNLLPFCKSGGCPYYAVDIVKRTNCRSIALNKIQLLMINLYLDRSN